MVLPMLMIGLDAAGLLPCLQDIKGVPKTEMLYTLTGMTGSLMYMAPEVIWVVLPLFHHKTSLHYSSPTKEACMICILPCEPVIAF